MGSATEDFFKDTKLLSRGLLALAGFEGIRTKVRVIDESLRRSGILLLGHWCCGRCCHLLLLLLLGSLLDLELLFIGAIGGAVAQKEGVGVVDIIRGRRTRRFSFIWSQELRRRRSAQEATSRRSMIRARATALMLTSSSVRSTSSTTLFPN